MLLFRSEAHIDQWCKLWQQPRGETFSLQQQWALAKAWYHDRLDFDWRRKTPDTVRQIFNDIGLTGPFWSID